MRWDNLFDDLESQLEGGLRADEADLLVEEERLRLARLSLRERLSALMQEGGAVRLLLVSGQTADLTPATLGRDWVSGELATVGTARHHAIVPFSALQGVVLTRAQVSNSIVPSARAATAEGEGLSARLGLGYVLRDLCRRRSAVTISFTAGGTAHGTVDRVGRDHLDLAVHEAGVPRRESSVSYYRVIPLSVVEMVRTG
ncbi:MAG: hypothetical protein IR160_13090 [Salinibacterium sp.]|nr:hypothetical protein [Salinibacterium sp.]MBF0673510.1 hypothetical protein [Salinibacterium sp.]